MNTISLKNVKAGDIFKRKPDAQTVFIRDHYNRDDKTYTCTDWYDIGRCIFLKGTTQVFVDFDF
jgi:hypothetical protein